MIPKFVNEVSKSNSRKCYGCKRNIPKGETCTTFRVQEHYGTSKRSLCVDCGIKCISFHVESLVKVRGELLDVLAK